MIILQMIFFYIMDDIFLEVKLSCNEYSWRYFGDPILDTYSVESDEHFNHISMLVLQAWSSMRGFLMQIWGSLVCPLLGKTWSIISSYLLQNSSVFFLQGKFWDSFVFPLRGKIRGIIPSHVFHRVMLILMMIQGGKKVLYMQVLIGLSIHILHNKCWLLP